jgi:DNA-binding transcriptional ArsR family regulator
MSTPYAIADVAALVGEPTRAAILLALMGGHSLSAGTLALEANLSPAATSLHLSKLTRGGLLSFERKGRCHFYRLSNHEVAHALEALGAIATAHRPGRALSPARAAFRAARTCYDHLAGELSVALTRRLERDGMVCCASSHAYEVTDRGEHWLAAEMGIDVAALARVRRVLARRCIDGTERRPHVGGALGAAMLERMLSLRWLAKVSGSRVLRTTLRGEEALRRLVSP